MYRVTLQDYVADDVGMTYQVGYRPNLLRVRGSTPCLGLDIEVSYLSLSDFEFTSLTKVWWRGFLGAV